MRSSTRIACLGPVLTGLVLAVSTGCGAPPWKQSSTADATPVVSVTPKATPTPTPKVENDLAKGSVKHQLDAGGVQVDANYWSTLALGKWTATATKPLTVSLTGRFTDGSKQNVYLNSVTVATDVTGPEGPLTAPEAMVDNATVSPGYLVTAPSSYVNVFNVGALDEGATSVTLNITYQLLAQSAPKSKTYLKQAASDTLVIALTD